MISQSEAPASEEIEVHKYRRDTSSSTSYFSSVTVETGLTCLTGGTRVSLTPEKRIPKKKKNIKFKTLSPFLPRNKRILNEENDDNPETTYTRLSEKYDMSHTCTYNFTEKTKYIKIQIMMKNTRRKLLNLKTLMKVFGTRVSLTPEKRIPKKKKNIKSKTLSPFLPRNKRILNEENDDNPETTYTRLSEKYDMSHTCTYNFTEKTKYIKIQIMMKNTRRKLLNLKTLMKVFII